MFSDAQLFQDIRVLLQRVQGHQVQELQLQQSPLKGGLEAAAVTRVSARYRCEAGRSRRTVFVLKQMDGSAVREVQLYNMLEAGGGESFAPRLLGVQEWSGLQFLCLEAVNPVRSWPWRDQICTGDVLGLLARLHTRATPFEKTAIPAWNYESHLEQMGLKTLEVLESLPRTPLLLPLTKHLPALRRIVHALPSLRQQLLSWPVFGSTFIHGDVHPGNVLIQRRNGQEVPTLLDWARARFGSPLEDVSSWLQSLSYWEPEVRRRHDTLLCDYLAARDLPRRITSEVREGYWLAGASNVLSGALLHHLQFLTQVGEPQPAAISSARDWLRIIRRADDCWRAGGGLN